MADDTWSRRLSQESRPAALCSPADSPPSEEPPCDEKKLIWPWLRPLLRSADRVGGAWLPAVLLVQLITGAALFAAVGLFCDHRGITVWSVATAADARIPVLPWSVVVYLSFELLFVVVALAAPRGRRGRRELVLVFQSFFAVGAISIATFMAFPCKVNGRGTLELQAGVFRSAFELIHGFDPPWNAWPSLHVSLSLLCFLALSRWYGTGRPLLRAGMAVWWLAIALSTLTTKQHYIFDVLTGAALGAATWRYYLAPAFVSVTERDVP